MRLHTSALSGGAALDLNAVEPKPKKWISDMTWLNLVELSKQQQFSQILGQVARNDRVRSTSHLLNVFYYFPFSQAWKDWFDSDTPEEMPIPDGYGTSLDTFHKLLLVRSWCPDRAIPMAKIYVGEVMGKRVR